MTNTTKDDAALLATQRMKFHEALIEQGALAVDSRGVATNADKGNKASMAIARHMADDIASHCHGTFAGTRQAGQTSGSIFEIAVADFVRETFPRLQHLRPGWWDVMRLGNQSAMKTSDFAQYEHLEYLTELTRENARLRSILGNDYMVAPDIVVYRHPCTDEEINELFTVVDDTVAGMSDIRARDGARPILHASISAKWTMRSDRAQNSRTEALNLIRNRKGNLPHIVVVTGEPVPSRIASLALGTGDIDCVYHFALRELVSAVDAYGHDDMSELLGTLIAGRRLKDISDLPLDLSV